MRRNARVAASFLVLLGGCSAAYRGGGARMSPAGGVAAAAPAPAPAAASGPATFVVLLAGGVPTPVLRGPFVITSINPGGSLELGLSSEESCTPVTDWFSYSGGGAAVAAGQILCARSSSADEVRHGFSGHAP